MAIAQPDRHSTHLELVLKLTSLIPALLAAALSILGWAAATWDVRSKGRLLEILAEGMMPPGDVWLNGALYLAIAAALVGGLAWLGRVRLVPALWSLLPCAIGWLRLFGWNAAHTAAEQDRILWNHLLILGVAVSAGLLAWNSRPSEARPESLLEPAKLPNPWELRAVIFAALAYSVAMTLLSQWRLSAFVPGTLDLAMYEQLHWSMLHYRPFHTTVFELPWGISLRQFGYSYHAEHFMPIVAVTSLIYGLWQSTVTLFAIHSFAIGFAAVPLFLWARSATGSRYFALAAAAGWLLHPLMQQANLKDFHPDALEGIFILTAFCAHHRRNAWIYGAALLGAMMCKEDVSLMVIAMGVFLMVGPRDFRWGAATVLAGAIYFGLIATPIMKAAEAGAPPVHYLRHLDRFAPLLPLGVDPPESLPGLAWIVATHPTRVFQLLAEISRLATLAKLLVPMGALCLLYPPALLIILPAIGIHIFSEWTMQANLELYHASTILPWLFASIVFAAAGMARLGAPVPESDDDKQRHVAHRRHATLAAMATTLFIAAVLSFREHGGLPLGGDHSSSDYMRFSRYDGSVNLVAQIPPEARVATVNELGPHLARRRYLYLLPDLPDDTEFVALDIQARNTYPIDGDAYRALMIALLDSGDWGTVWSDPRGQFLLKRGAPSDGNAAILARLRD